MCWYSTWSPLRPGGGFVPDALLAEVRRAPAYATLADNDWQWALQFVRQGGASLANYPRLSSRGAG